VFPVELGVTVGFAERLFQDFYPILGLPGGRIKGAHAIDSRIREPPAAIFFLLQSSFFEQRMIDKPLESDTRPHARARFEDIE